ncbi:MAG: Non-ribosomal peptide synthetase component [Verrucomicrobiales bacterium]|nr:Non-ribosomal peptide synthetase component [Verrucomicrobiales bacterium]
MPLNPNGKDELLALPSPESAVRARENEYVAPSNATEQKLAEIWAQVLGVENIGIRDNFFEVGGDSITSISVLSKAQQSGLVFSVQQLFQNPTVEGLAGCIGQSQPTARAERSTPYSLITNEDRAKLPADVEDAYPMIQLQTGMFYYNELNPVSAVYHDVFSFRIHSVLDENKLREALQRLLDRHPVLRTSFQISGYSEPMQLVHRNVKVPFTVLDVRHFDDADQDRLTIEWINTEKRNAFDRAKAPLIRFHAQLQTETSFQFIVSFHHVYLDGWSLAALLTEVFQDYSALRSNSGATIAAPQVAYRDFVALEKQTIVNAASRRFWKETYEDAPITMLPRWPKAMCEGGHEQFRGPELMVCTEVFEGIKKIAQLAGVPLKTVLLTAHQRVMALLYGQQDVTSGLVCNGRPEEIDGEKLIGLFLNTLPIRSRMEGGTWVDLVKQTFKAEQEIMAHRRMPLAEIQNMHGGQPLFEAAFDFVHFHVYKNLDGYKDLGFMEGHYFEANNLTTLTTFMLDITSTQLQMHLDYDPNVIARKQVEQISEYYINILKQMAGDPAGRYDQGSALTSEEKENLLKHWNQTGAAYPSEKCIHQLFEEQVAKTPGAIAVNFGLQKWTYDALNKKANSIAALLERNGVANENLVGLFLDRSPEMVAGLLGILKAGAAYVPLDPIYPKERLSQIISDSQMSGILTQDEYASLLPGQQRLFFLKELGGEDVLHSITPSRGSRSLAYTIYTSGSTGKPKGVQIEHRSVVNLLRCIADKTNFTAQDNLLAVTTVSFDIAGLEIFMPLLQGGTVTLASREQAADGIQLAQLLDSSEATVMQATPATWRLLIEAGWKGNRALKVFTGGEALPQILATELLKRTSEVWNLYGPTETTIWSTAWKVASGEPILIGTPLANTQVYILDQQLQPLPTGSVGELHIGGDGLARGYLKKEDLNREKFITAPLLGQPASRLYKTGDLARFLPDGQIQCLGRIDHQIKLRGYRIELGDIESSLRKHPAVKEAVVVAREDSGGDKQLVAYFTRHEQSATDDLREFLRSRIPDYMVPAAFVAMDKFPLTVSGKIDIRNLPAPSTFLEEKKRNFVAASSPIEMEIAAIWAEVLRLPQVGIDDNFFDLGGHSLKAIQCIVRIRENLGTELTLSNLIERPTIRGLAEVVLMSLLGDDKESEKLLAEVTQMSAMEAKHQLTLENVNGA